MATIRCQHHHHWWVTDKILTTGLIGMEVQEEQVTLIAIVPVTNLVVPTTTPIEKEKKHHSKTQIDRNKRAVFNPLSAT